MSSSDDEVMHILKQGFPNVELRITESSANKMHQNIFITNIVEVTVEYQEDGAENKKSVVLKIPKQSDATAIFDKLAYFTREVFMYDILIPRISSYLDTSLTPICYKTIDSRILILENLKFHDYKKKENCLLNLEQCLATVKVLADFHASSYKVGQMDSSLFKEEIFHYSAIMALTSQAAIFWEPILVELLAKNNESALIPKVKRINHYLKQEDNDLQSRIHYSKFKFVVLNHGDVHSDNILLQYDSNNSTKGVKMIDFQTSFWSSPAYDFMYFFILCGEIDVIQNHFETLLDWYLQCLNEKLERINCSKVYRQQDFLEDIKTVNFFSVLFALCRSFISYPLDRTQVLDACFFKQTEKVQYVTDICLNNEFFTSQILSILKLCEKLGLLEPPTSDSLESKRP